MNANVLAACLFNLPGCYLVFSLIQSYVFFLPSFVKILEKASRVKQDFAFILQVCQRKKSIPFPTKTCFLTVGSQISTFPFTPVSR